MTAVVRFETVAEIEGDGLPDAETTAPGISVRAKLSPPPSAPRSAAT